MAVDRRNPIPFYLQVIETLRAQVRDGKFAAGVQLPGEHELCQQFDVSRTVIRQALNELVREGLIVREKGRGTFVAQPKIKEKFFQKLTGFYQDMVDQGYEPVTQVLRQEVKPAASQIAEHLHISVQMPVIEIERLRFIEGEPIVYVTSFLPYARCPQLLETDLTNQSLYSFLERVGGIFITHGIRSIEAALAEKREAELLGIKRGAPVIHLDSVSYEADGTPVECYHAVHRGDRSRFEVELVRVREEPAGGLSGISTDMLPPGNSITAKKR